MPLRPFTPLHSPYDGSGLFSAYTPGNPVVTGTTISSTAFNNTINDICANGLSFALTKDGQQVPTGNIPMGGFKLTGLGTGTAATDAATVNQSGEWQTGPTPTFISTTSFSLVGNQTATFNFGRRLKTTNTSGTIYSSIVTAVFGAVTTVTVANDSGVLDSGLSAVSYGNLSSLHSAAPTYFPGTGLVLLNGGISVAGTIQTNTGLYFGLSTVMDTYEASTFLATITGMTATVTATASYVIIGTASQSLKIAVVNIPLMTGTSNATTCTITGAPNSLRPAVIKYLLGRTQDNSGSYAAALVQVETTGVLTLFKDVAGGAFTGSGTKSCSGSTYAYLLV